MVLLSLVYCRLEGCGTTTTWSTEGWKDVVLLYLVYCRLKRVWYYSTWPTVGWKGVVLLLYLVYCRLEGCGTAVLCPAPSRADQYEVCPLLGWTPGGRYQR